LKATAFVTHLRQLEELELAYNELGDLPDPVIERLRHLRVVTLQHNHLPRSVEALGTDAPDDSARRRHILRLVPPASD
jgi:hypothetical protein